eukprot:8797130-Pyramimonas_sp.AAC.1
MASMNQPLEVSGDSGSSSPATGNSGPGPSRHRRTASERRTAPAQPSMRALFASAYDAPPQQEDSGSGLTSAVLQDTLAPGDPEASGGEVPVVLPTAGHEGEAALSDFDSGPKDELFKKSIVHEYISFADMPDCIRRQFARLRPCEISPDDGRTTYIKRAKFTVTYTVVEECRHSSSD